METRYTDKGGYTQRIVTVNGKIKDITCTCMWTTMEMSRKEYKDRKPCRHIREILYEINKKKEADP